MQYQRETRARHESPRGPLILARVSELLFRFLWQKVLLRLLKRREKLATRVYGMMLR